MKIIIDGVELTPAQTESVRVAVSSLLMELQHNPSALGNDDTGMAIARGYRTNLREVERLLVGLPGRGVKEERR